MAITIESIQIGPPMQLGSPDAADPFDGIWTTGIYKAPVSGPVFVRTTGLEGDRQADLEAHGGADKAVCVYAGDHYAEWQRTPELASIGPGGFGENFTVRGITEEDACIGDLFRAGDLMVQISQPRQPCWKLARKWRIRDFADRVIRAGRTGWYFRVLAEAQVSAGAELVLVERPFPDWTIEASNRVMHGRPRDRAAAAELASVPPLSASWRVTLTARI